MAGRGPAALDAAGARVRAALEGVFRHAAGIGAAVTEIGADSGWLLAAAPDGLPGGQRVPQPRRRRRS